MSVKMPRSQGWIPLHNHTEYSFLDSVIKIKGLGKILKSKGFKSYAITDHGNVNGTYAFYEELSKAGVKPILGIEAYICPDRHRKGLTDDERELFKLSEYKGKGLRERSKEIEKELGVNERYHIVILAKNQIGFKKILKAVEISHTEGFYRFPRIDTETLIDMVGDCIVLTACIGGVPGKMILNGNYDGAKKWCNVISSRFKDDFYLEIQPNEMPEQIVVNNGLVKLSKELGIKLVATNDVHYINKDEYEVHDTLLALRDSQHGKTVFVNDPDRFRYGTKELYLKSDKELYDSFRVFHNSIPDNVIREAINNTIEIDNKIESNVIVIRKGILPEVNTYGKTSEDYFMSLIRLGWANKKINKKCSGKVGLIDWVDGEKAREAPLEQVYMERVKYEYSIITKLGFTNYFLVIYDLIKWCRQTGIRPGPGRGSVAGSLIAYLLGITAVDSIKLDCPFSRFITEDRQDYPDIDCFAPDSPVLTIDGWKKIKDVVPGVDVVATRHGWRKVKIKHFRHYKGKAVKLTTENGNSFICTPQHRIIESQKGSVQANDWRKKENKAILLKLQNFFYGSEGDKVLFKELCEQFEKGDNLQYVSTRRKDGTEMFHVREENETSQLGVSEEILRYGMQEQIICREETLTKETQDYDGIVYNLTVEGEAEYNIAGIAVHNCDFPTDEREQVKQYLRDKYGSKNVAGICTFGRMKGKQTLRDVARVYGVPNNEVNEITKHILARDQGEVGEFECIKDSLLESKELEEFANKYPRVVKFAIALEGLCRQLGAHAAGMIVADEPVVNICPVQLQRRQGGSVGDPITGWDKTQVEKVGLLKLDILGIEALTYIQKCLNSIKDRTGKVIEPEDWEDYNDPQVWEAFQKGHTELVWQLNQPSAIRLLKQLKPDSFNHIVAANALLRPGPLNSGITAEYVNRRHGEMAPSLHEDLDRILEKTYGLMVFQEDTLKIAHDMAGFSWVKADKLRKAIGKKRIDKIHALKDDFVKGFISNGYTEDLGNRIFNQIEEFSKYGFNIGHSSSYSLLGYWTMYLKLHYPLDFLCSALQTETNDIKRRSIIKEAKRLNIDVLPPDVNISGDTFVIDKDRPNTIRSGFSGVKGVGNKTLDKILEGRPYTDIKDFILRSGANKTVVSILLRVGALDSLTSSPAAFDSVLDEVLKVRRRKDPDKCWLEIESKLFEVSKKRYNEEEVDKYCLEYLALPPQVHLAARAKLKYAEIYKDMNICNIGDHEELFEDDYSVNYEWFIGTVGEIKTYHDDFGGRQGKSGRVLLGDESGEIQLSIPCDVLETFGLDNLKIDVPLLVLAKSQGKEKLQAGLISKLDSFTIPSEFDGLENTGSLDIRRGKADVIVKILAMKIWVGKGEENYSLCVVDKNLIAKEITVWSDVKRNYGSKFELGKLISCNVSVYKGRYSVNTNKEKGGKPVRSIQNAT